MSVLAHLHEALGAIRVQTSLTPAVGVVLGSGLGAWAEGLEETDRIPYREIPHMPVSTVVGHPGFLVLGRSGSVPVACLQGRVHLYEGHAPERVVFGVRALARLGCRAVLLTNAAGGVNASFSPGDLMLITDHLNLQGTNPLLGPTYETPAEIRMLRMLGADAVGMSTVPEIIALRHMGVPAAAVSCITNLAAGITGAELSHAEVEETAKRSRARFVELLSTWVRKAGAEAARWGAGS